MSWELIKDGIIWLKDGLIWLVKDILIDIAIDALKGWLLSNFSPQKRVPFLAIISSSASLVFWGITWVPWPHIFPEGPSSESADTSPSTKVFFLESADASSGTEDSLSESTGASSNTGDFSSETPDTSLITKDHRETKEVEMDLPQPEPCHESKCREQGPKPNGGEQGPKPNGGEQGPKPNGGEQGPNLENDYLFDRVIEDTSDLGRVVHNLHSQHPAPNNNTLQMTMRDTNQHNWTGMQEHKVGVYVNGVYLARPQGNVFDLVDIDRVEVIPGPQGTSSGRNTTSGTINITTNRPTDEFDNLLTQGLGVDGTFMTKAIMNTSIIEDKLAMRLAAQQRRSNGYVENTATGQPWNDENALNLRWSARFTLNDGAMIDIIADYQRVREKPALGHCERSEPEDGEEFTAFLPSIAHIFGIHDEILNVCDNTEPYRSNENAPGVNNIDTWGTVVDARLEWKSINFTVIAAHRSVRDQNSSWGLAFNPVGSGSFLNIVDGKPNKSVYSSLELRLGNIEEEMDRNGGFDWVVGVHLFREESVRDFEVLLFHDVDAPSCDEWAVFCAPVPYLPTSTWGDVALRLQETGSRYQMIDSVSTSGAPFGEISSKINQDWSLTAGVRFTRDNRELERMELPYSSRGAGVSANNHECPDKEHLVNGGICFRENEASKWTPRIKFIWQNNGKGPEGYIEWARGYAVGGFNQGALMSPFEDEESNNWEAGLNLEGHVGGLFFISNRKSKPTSESEFNFDIALFYNAYDNLQVTVGRLVNGIPADYIINAQQATLYGMEGEFSMKLLDDWYVEGNFGVINGAYDEFTFEDTLFMVEDDHLIFNVETGFPVEETITRNLKDFEVVRGPNLTFTISLGKRFIFKNRSKIKGQVGWSFRGRSYNTLEAHKSSRQGGYSLMDGRLVWCSANGRYGFALWGTNLLNRAFFNTAVDLTRGSNGLGTNTKYWGEPRRFGLDFIYWSKGCVANR